MRFDIEKVYYMPEDIRPGILYVSEEFEIAIHLCACGCGMKVSTPLGPTEWSLKESNSGPSLNPSIGNWQFPCQSHYWIDEGEVHWSSKWSPEKIAEGRRNEEERRQAYYEEFYRQKRSPLQKFWEWLKGLFKK